MIGVNWTDRRVLALVLFLAASSAAYAQAANPLPSWNDGRERQSIIKFVTAAAREGSPDFVPVEKRIAVFDNDGTLWCKQPTYVQLAFALDRVKTLAPTHPEWCKRQPFKAALDGNIKEVAASGDRRLPQLILASPAGMTTDEFAHIVKKWLATARHPRFRRPYTDLVYEPMMELFSYLRGNNV